MTEPSLPELEDLRDRLYAQLAATGDFRRGSVTENYRKCGKPNCACAAPGHPGHGPRFLWTRTQGRRKRVGRQLAAAEVAKVRREIARDAEFTATVEQIVEVSEKICEARRAGRAARAGTPPGRRGKRGLFAALAAEKSAELGRLAAKAARCLGCEGGLEAAETVLRAGLLELGGSMLAQPPVRRPRPARPAAALRPGTRSGIHRLPGQDIRHRSSGRSPSAAPGTAARNASTGSRRATPNSASRARPCRRG